MRFTLIWAKTATRGISARRARNICFAEDVGAVVVRLQRKQRSEPTAQLVRKSTLHRLVSGRSCDAWLEARLRHFSAIHNIPV